MDKWQFVFSGNLQIAYLFWEVGINRVFFYNQYTKRMLKLQLFLTSKIIVQYSGDF